MKSIRGELQEISRISNNGNDKMKFLDAYVNYGVTKTRTQEAEKDGWTWKENIMKVLSLKEYHDELFGNEIIAYAFNLTFMVQGNKRR